MLSQYVQVAAVCVCRMLRHIFRCGFTPKGWGLDLLQEFSKLLSVDDIETFNNMYLLTINTLEDLCVAYTKWLCINPFSTKLYLSDLKTHFVPRSKHSLLRF